VKTAAPKVRAEWLKVAGRLLTAFADAQSNPILNFRDFAETVNAFCYCSELIRVKDAANSPDLFTTGIEQVVYRRDEFLSLFVDDQNTFTEKESSNIILYSG
jgi:hypothetical protein